MTNEKDALRKKFAETRAAYFQVTGTKNTEEARWRYEARCRGYLGMCPDGCCGHEEGPVTPQEWVMVAEAILEDAREGA